VRYLDGIPVVRVIGSPSERGRQRGQLIPDMVRRRVDSQVRAYSGLATRDRLLRLADEAESALVARAPETIEELDGIARGAGLDWDDLRIAALVRTVGFQAAIGSAVSQEDCLCIAISGAATTNGEPVLGKNGDFVLSVSALDDLFITEVVPDHGHPHVAIGVYPEKPTQPEGMNDRGLTVVGAGQYPSDGRAAFEAGRPTGACLYHVLARVYRECETIEEAVELLRPGPRGYTGRVMFIGDDSGRWAKLEITYDDLHVAYSDAGHRVAAGTSGVFNEPRMQAMITSPRDRPAAYARYQRAMDLLSEQTGRLNAERARAILAMHGPDGPGLSTPCKHVDGIAPESLPPLECLPTLESLVFEPAQLRGWLAKGPPCTTSFLSFEVPCR
jgi:hypothetical protein